MKRYLLFIFGCIGARTLLTLLSKNVDLLPYIGFITLFISLGFLYIYTFGSDTADKQLEWLGDKKIWWQHLRLVHGLLYLLFTVLAFSKNSYSWTVLATDTFLGLVVWILHTFYKINF